MTTPLTAWSKECLTTHHLCSSLLRLAQQPVTVDNLRALILTAPRDQWELQSGQWRAHSHCCRLMIEADCRARAAGNLDQLQEVMNYFILTIPSFSRATRRALEESFFALLREIQTEALAS